MKRIIITTLFAIALGAGSAPAIVYYANTDLTTPPSGATFTAVGGSLGTKSQAGFTILGVTGGPSGNEIDIGQSLLIDFTAAQRFDSLSLGLLFDGPEYNDNMEIAAALTDGSATVFTLKATGTTSATWTGFAGATVTNIGSAVNGEGGAWRIDNPFGALGVTQLRLYPLSSAPTQNESDFGLHAFRTTAVPEAGSTLTLLGLAMLGMVAAARRFRR
ncbi:MAG: hypothetical protein R3F07_10850 [Opitutaceae bacterium]